MTLPSFTASITTVSRKRLAFLSIVIFAVGVALSLGMAQRQGLFAISDTTAQKYTELYFTKSSALPSRLVAGQQYRIPFALVNHQGVPQTVRYQVTILQGANAAPQPVQTAELANGQRLVHTLQFTPTQPVADTTVQVQLLGTAQAISFRARP